MHNIIMTLITALIPVVMSVIGYYLAKYVKTPARLQTITDLVNAAVVFAEKSGAVQQLTGSQQFKLAYNFVQDKAKQLGITDLDEELIKTLIEQSWANQREHLNAVYESGKKQADEEVAEDKKAKLTELQEQLANEQQEIEKERTALKSTVNALQGALNQNQPDTKADIQDSKPTNGAKPASDNALQGALNQNQPDAEPNAKADTQDSKPTNEAKPVSQDSKSTNGAKPVSE